MKIEIPKKSVLKLLGYSGGEIKPSIAAALDECIQEAENLAEPRYAYKIMDAAVSSDGALCVETLSLPGCDICKHLEKSERCCVLALTIGEKIEEESKMLMDAEPLKGYIMDACGSAAAEALADIVQEKIAEEAGRMGYFLTSRYSPGYGDLSLDVQPKILELLGKTGELGITITESFMLVPRKSITAFIGLQKEPFVPTVEKCTLCHAFEGCAFLKKGLFCGD